MQKDQEREPHSLYTQFIKFVASELDQERSLLNRKMRTVLLWCFFLPLILSILLLAFIKGGVLPYRARSYLDWIFLFFPLSYAVYFLVSEVFGPGAIKRGGGALSEALAAASWRHGVCAKMVAKLSATREEWEWLLCNFEMELRALQYRARYITALAGAVFFLILEGFEYSDPLDGYPKDYSEWIALGLFLVLLYLSSSRYVQSLRRYADCLELLCRSGAPRT